MTGGAKLCSPLFNYIVGRVRAQPALAERRALKAEVLIIGRYPRIPDQHHRNPVANIVAKRLPFRDRTLQWRDLSAAFSCSASRRMYKFCDGPGVVVRIG
jgi:hypothetical protein